MHRPDCFVHRVRLSITQETRFIFCIKSTGHTEIVSVYVIFSACWIKHISRGAQYLLIVFWFSTAAYYGNDDDTITHHQKLCSWLLWAQLHRLGLRLSREVTYPFLVYKWRIYDLTTLGTEGLCFAANPLWTRGSIHYSTTCKGLQVGSYNQYYVVLGLSVAQQTNVSLY